MLAAMVSGLISGDGSDTGLVEWLHDSPIDFCRKLGFTRQLQPRRVKTVGKRIGQHVTLPDFRRWRAVSTGGRIRIPVVSTARSRETGGALGRGRASRPPSSGGDGRRSRRRRRGRSAVGAKAPAGNSPRHRVPKGTGRPSARCARRIACPARPIKPLRTRLLAPTTPPKPLRPNGRRPANRRRGGPPFFQPVRTSYVSALLIGSINRQADNK